MASKRPKKAKNLNNKKPKPCSNLDDLTSLIGEDIDYCFHIFNLEESLKQGDINNLENVHLFNLKFQLIDLKYIDVWPQVPGHLEACLVVNAIDEVLLFVNCNQRLQYCRAILIEPQNLNFSYETITSSGIFQTLNSPTKFKGILSIEANVNLESLTFELNIFLFKRFIINDYTTIPTDNPKKNGTILKLMQFFCGYQSNNGDVLNKPSSISIDEFYSMVHEKQLEESEFESITLPKLGSLVPTLRSYQESAVKWMLHREYHNKVKDHQILYVKHKFVTEELYYHVHLGYFIRKSAYSQYIANFPVSFGGILADEMGLGKTVETLALILHNRKANIKVNFGFFNQSNLFSLSSNPLAGNVQCSCGMLDQVSVIENTRLDTLLERCLEQKYWLNENLIKCLLCANYQHIECTSYQIDQDDYPYLCSHCWAKVDPIDSGCTLIVCPKSILQQWKDEIEKHLVNIKVHIYTGIRGNEDFLSPVHLAKFDIVITCYNVLRSEIDFSSSFDYGHLRRAKRFFSPLSPLLSVNWWRLCFDEAQLVEGTFSRAAQMASALIANYRWAITGTPIQQSVDDLHGLLYFINERPFCNKAIWNGALYSPYCSGNTEPLVGAIQNCFWRTPKSAVINEIQLSVPIYSLKKLEFSQIERDFYLHQASLCQDAVKGQLARMDPNRKLSELPQTVRLFVLNHALKLRQTCCHPRICFPPTLSARQFNSLQDVLDKMLQDLKVNAIKAHRDYIAAVIGTAGILILQDDFKGAIETYRSALSSVFKYEEYFPTDSCQKYHIYYNLAEIVELFGCIQVDSNNDPFPAFNGEKSTTPSELNVDTGDISSLELTDEDKQLRLKAKQIYDKYILSTKLACITTDKYRLELISKSTDTIKSFQFKGKWFIAALGSLSKITDLNEIDAYITQSRSLNILHFLNPSTFTTSTVSIEAIKRMLDYKFSIMETSREEMISMFDHLLDQILSLEKVDQFINCHVKKGKQKKGQTVKCILCLTEAAVKDYESNLFNMQFRSSPQEEGENDNEKSDTNEISDGNWNESNCLLALRRLGQLYKSKAKSFSVADHKPMVTEIDRFFQYLEDIKKEFKAHRKFWQNLSEYVLRIDELNQAQTRISGAIDGFSFGNMNQNFTDQEDAFEQVHQNLAAKMVDFSVDRSHGEKKLAEHVTRLKYLKCLNESLKDKDSVESRVCSICWSDLERYYVLSCGHFFCVSCTTKLEGLSQQSCIKCSVCRQETGKTSLSIVASQTEEQKREVIGSWTTKIVHIIRCVVEILKAKEKILIFSTWTKMLEIMQEALTVNEISSLIVSSSDRHFADKIRKFKTSLTDNVLLLPINFACNGLNLIEASHVIFINSSLNKADELQAIGRIYRIGQQRQTHVHKFIIQGTMEELVENHHESVYHRQKGANSEFSNMTVSQFSNLFFPRPVYYSLSD